MSTAKNTPETLDAPDPTWWRYPTAAALLVPLCWAALEVITVGRSLVGYCALHSGCGHGGQDTRRHVALGFACAQLALAALSWPMPLTRRWTIARFVLSAFSALCGVGAGLVALVA
ncbi:hypothetical protein [Kitasatospora sp. NPDC017646]|uniref:hypothetical protein n=1 Tax=Kitasatospora sp. NPDC017646 TaxID=3364024 RepID=UPI0037950364